MSTWSLLRWIALVAGAELAVRGHLADRSWVCHGGAALFALALVGLVWPTRVRRLGLVIGGVAWFCLVATDAALARRALPGLPSPATACDLAVAGGESTASPAPPAQAGGSSVILAFGGGATAGLFGDDRSWPADLAASLRERFHCARRVEVVDARQPGALLGDAAALAAALATYRPDLVLVRGGPGLIEAMLEESPALRFPAPEAIGPRASPLASALEAQLATWRSDRRWRRALASDVALDPRSSPVAARYRELVLTARRAGADVALLIPALSSAAESSDEMLRSCEIAHPQLRSWILASHAHARITRAIAGSYGIRAIEVLSRQVDAVATALAEPLARAPFGCRARRPTRESADAQPARPRSGRAARRSRAKRGLPRRRAGERRRAPARVRGE